MADAHIFFILGNTVGRVCLTLFLQTHAQKGERSMGNKFLQYFALTIAVIGAINWGLIGFFNLNLVSLLFGSMSWISRVIYGLVGLCGIYLLTFYGVVAQEQPE